MISAQAGMTAVTRRRRSGSSATTPATWRMYRAARSSRAGRASAARRAWRCRHDAVGSILSQCRQARGPPLLVAPSRSRSGRRLELPSALTVMPRGWASASVMPTPRSRRLCSAPAQHAERQALTSCTARGRALRARYRARYTLGAAMPARGDACRASDPWTVKRAIEALQADAVTAPVGGYASSSSCSRPATVWPGSGRASPSSAARSGSATTCATISTGRSDLSAGTLRGLSDRRPHDPGHQRRLRGPLAGRLRDGQRDRHRVTHSWARVAAMAVDPWLTLWAMAPLSDAHRLGARFNAIAAREHAGSPGAARRAVGRWSRSTWPGWPWSRAYTMESSARAEFDRANGIPPPRSHGGPRAGAGSCLLTGLVSGRGRCSSCCGIGGGAVIDGRLSLGALVAFNGYLAYPGVTDAGVGWTSGDVPTRAHLDGADPGDAIALGYRPRAGPPAHAGPPASASPRSPSPYDGREPALRDVTLRGGARRDGRRRGTDRAAASPRWACCWPGSGSRRPARSSSAGTTSPRCPCTGFVPRWPGCPRTRFSSRARSPTT